MKRNLGPQFALYPSPTLVVGSYCADGRPNIMTAGMGGIVSGRPASVAVSLRQATLSYENLMREREFTVSIPGEAWAREVDYAGIVSGRDRDKFADTGLTPVRAERVNAPYVLEFPVNLECRLVAVHELGLHTQFVGEIVNVLADEDVLGGNGFPDIEKVRPLFYSITKDGQYYGIGERKGRVFVCGRELIKG